MLVLSGKYNKDTARCLQASLLLPGLGLELFALPSYGQRTTLLVRVSDRNKLVAVHYVLVDTLRVIHGGLPDFRELSSAALANPMAEFKFCSAPSCDSWLSEEGCRSVIHAPPKNFLRRTGYDLETRIRILA